jgi:carbamoyl-phosphate synthase large subunit
VTSTATVLVSSAGRRVELLKAFRQALADLGLEGQVLATDRSWYSSAAHSADARFEVPSCDRPEFVPHMVELCAQHDVDLVVPTIDTELPVLAAARDAFAAVGATVAVSAPAVVDVAGDKVATHSWLTAHGFPTVRQATLAEVEADDLAWPFPLVVKPRFGSAAKGVAVVTDGDELAVAARAGEVVAQTVAAGDEYTIDALVDRAGRCVCAVPRRRIEVRAGEVAKAVTVHAPVLERLAADICEALPGAYGALAIQVFADAGFVDPTVIELNARFGGGYPLSRQAGADFPRWILEEVVGLPSSAHADGWRDGLVMLRYDAAVFVADEDGRS